MKQTTKIIASALIAACLAETAMPASANGAKAWMRPENLRWACYQWENKVHFRRMGGPHVPFVDGIRRFADPFMPYTTESDDGVFIEPRINAEGRLFIHVLNFWDSEKRFRITLKQGMPVKAYDLGDNAVAIDGRTVSGRVKNYLVIDCGTN